MQLTAKAFKPTKTLQKLRVKNALFVLKILNFLSWHFVHVEKTARSQRQTSQTIRIHVWFNIFQRQKSDNEI